MSDSDLRDLLAEKPGEAPGGEAGGEGGAAAGPPPSPTVLEMDRWSTRRGAAIAAAWEEAGAGKVAPEIAADAHAALFEPEPELAERPAEAGRAAWWKQAMETPEYRALHAQTCLDPWLAGVGAKTLADQWREYSAQEPEPREPEPGEEPGSEGEPLGRTLKRMRSIAKALKGATEEVGAAKDTAAGLGMGAGGGPLDPKALAAAFKRVRSDETLRRILEMAGRMRARAQSLQRTKVRAERGEITGIELSGDVGRLVPGELAQVAGVVPELETLALLRLAQRRALSYRQRRSEKVAAGPIVMCVDESGSMSGERVIAAKALALTMAWVARFQKRWIALAGFSGGSKGHCYVQAPTAKPDEAALITWLQHFYGGGTTMNVPLVEVPRWWDGWVRDGLARGKTDLLLITDACVDVPSEMEKSFRAWKEREQARTYGLIIGEREAGDLARVCDRWWAMEQLTLDQAAVEACLSV